MKAVLQNWGGVDGEMDYLFVYGSRSSTQLKEINLNSFTKIN